METATTRQKSFVVEIQTAGCRGLTPSGGSGVSQILFSKNLTGQMMIATDTHEQCKGDWVFRAYHPARRNQKVVSRELKVEAATARPYVFSFVVKAPYATWGMCNYVFHLRPMRWPDVAWRFAGLSC